jgi:hypothetical protein
MTDQAISPLRRRMIEMLWVRGGEAWHYRRCCDQPVELSPCVSRTT